MQTPIRRSILMSGTDPETKREELRRYFHDTYDLFERLFEPFVGDEAFYVQPEPLRHPHIFYFGHTATFYINKLTLAKATGRINPHYESMFAIGVDEMSWDDLNDQNYDWPTVEAVRAYRKAAREAVDQVIDHLDMKLPISWEDHPAWAVVMGIEHERIHIETSSVLIRQTPLKWLKPSTHWPICPDRGEAPENELLPVSGGSVCLGRSRENSRLYGWDNEFGHHSAEVADFKASRFLVSNAEYLGFIEAGGYETPRWWSEEGQSWLAYTQAKHPPFWLKEADGYRYRAMLEVIDMPWSWPVEVNYLEAKAFCSWLSEKSGESIRLPTEDEYTRLRDQVGVANEPEWPTPVEWNINLEHYASSTPVDRFMKEGFGDVIGNVWQWSETPIYPFEGFEVHPLYDDFSTPTFDNRHNLIKGGSWISTGNEASIDSRYAFRRHFFQHAGFRYIRAAPLTAADREPNTLYESDHAVAQYCEAHYGPGYFGVENFPKALIEWALAAHGSAPRARALELACAVGRGSFELAKQFDEVVGIDFSARFISQAIALQKSGEVRWLTPIEGDLTLKRHATLEALGLKAGADRLTFWQGDACNLKPHFTGYDLVVAGNLIDRLYDPAGFLSTIHERINPGGTLVIASPYSWSEAHTQKSRWLGGFEEDGQPCYARDRITAILGTHFEPIGEGEDLPFVLRESARRFQHTVSEVSAWRRR
jgi:5-histidylcysteine sulfoxide synthase/putative 4-mercaptohistidine N1-methyltranferase